MKTAVLLLAYNRAPLTEEQLALLVRTKKVGKIFISVDGPKTTSQSKSQVKKVRTVVKKYARNFPDQVTFRFSRQNLGCQRGVETGLDWFFQHNSEGIILEDDCVPHPDFFRYTQELLRKYRTDSRIGMISGTNPMLEETSPSSYFFSHQSHVWGWATWKRSWQDYHLIKAKGPELIQQNLVRSSLLRFTTAKHLSAIQKVFEGKIDTWDYIWYLTNLMMSRYCILPTHNLVSNVGFSPEATHTKVKTTHAELPVSNLTFPLIHPESFTVNTRFERRYLREIYLHRMIFSMLKAYLNPFFRFQR